MNPRTLKAWTVNLLIVLALVAAGAAVKKYQSCARADDIAPGVASGEILVNATEGKDEHLVLIDKKNMQIMVYRTQGLGEFRLVTARSYKYDLEIPGDTSQSREVENNGITYARAVELYNINK